MVSCRTNRRESLRKQFRRDVLELRPSWLGRGNAALGAGAQRATEDRRGMYMKGNKERGREGGGGHRGLGGPNVYIYVTARPGSNKSQLRASSVGNVRCLTRSSFRGRRVQFLVPRPRVVSCRSQAVGS